MGRGVNRCHTFVDDADYESYTSLLAATVRGYGWHVFAYCLMPNHVHLLVETPEPNLGAGMQLLHGRYARLFNERHHRVGHLFQDRFKSPRITSEAAFVRVIPYVVLNPVAAGLCRSPEDWRWGSHAVVTRPGRVRWLAHELMGDRLEAITGTRCYSELIATWAQAAA